MGAEHVVATPPLRGRCLCGAIGLAVKATHDAFVLCHCGQCRKSAGAAFVALLAKPGERPAGIYMWAVFAPGVLAAGSGGGVVEYFHADRLAGQTDETRTAAGDGSTDRIRERLF